MPNAVDTAVLELPHRTKAHALEEGRNDPRFWSYFTPLATSSNPAKAVDDDMKRAVINELDPSSYRDTKGRWPLLRRRVRSSVSVLTNHVRTDGHLSGLARFISGLGQEDVPGLVTTLDVPETTAQVPGLVTNLDMETPSAGVPGLTTEVPQVTPTPEPDPSAGEESAAFKQSLGPSEPAAGAQAAQAAGAAAKAAPAIARPAAKPAAAPAPASPDIWSTIAKGIVAAGGAGAAIYAQSAQQQAAKSAAQTLQAAQQRALLAQQQAGSLFGGGGSSGSLILYGLLGLMGVGGLLLLFKYMNPAGGRRRSR